MRSSTQNLKLKFENKVRKVVLAFSSLNYAINDCWYWRKQVFNWAFLIQLANLCSHGKSQSDSLAMEISMALSGVQEIFKNSRGNQLFCISWYLILMKFGGLNMLIAKFGSTTLCY